MMKRARTGILATAVLAVATMAFAQAKADFSGSWAPEVDPAAAPAGGGGGGGRGMMAGPMTVKQTATDLTVERSVGENKIVQVYKLDGSESVNKQMGRGGEVEIKSKAKWDGAKLVITSTRPGQDGAPIETTATWSVTGGVLTIENAGGRGPSKQTYKKTT
jgi:uncharacterized protein YdeI (BOF family)